MGAKAGSEPGTVLIRLDISETCLINIVCMLIGIQIHVNVEECGASSMFF